MIRETRRSKAEIVNFQNITISKPVEYSTPLYDTVKAILSQKITILRNADFQFSRKLEDGRTEINVDAIAAFLR